MVKLYLDTCSIQRPLDTLLQIRIRLEAEAILGLLAQVSKGKIELISSTVLELEIMRNPLAMRREHGEQVLALATTIVIVDEFIEQRATKFAQLGVKMMDALHLAVAEVANAEYFCTCDDRFLRRAKTLPNLRTKIVAPLQLIEEIDL